MRPKKQMKNTSASQKQTPDHRSCAHGGLPGEQMHRRRPVSQRYPRLHAPGMFPTKNLQRARPGPGCRFEGLPPVTCPLLAGVRPLTERSICHLYYCKSWATRVCILFLNMFIDYSITVVPFHPLHSTPSCTPPPSHSPPL